MQNLNKAYVQRQLRAAKGFVRRIWLKSEHPDLFGLAMSKCQHSYGICCQTGECAYEGKCFKELEQALKGGCDASN